MNDKWFHLLRELTAAEDAREAAFDVEGNDGLPLSEIIHDQHEAELGLNRAWLKAREMLRQEEEEGEEGEASLKSPIGEPTNPGLTSLQKAVLNRLLRHAYQDGFGSYYPLQPIATELGLTVEQLYDNETNTGVLWELGPHGNVGLIEVLPGEWTSARVPIDVRGLAEAWSGFVP